MSGTQALECDLVMRGGITSGIVYPKAIAKLAETYKFRCIGGTSAGAIAAAATAAAALGARNGKDHFQTRFKGLPEELADGGEQGNPSVLQRLFQPQPGTRRLFNVLMAGLGRDHWAIKSLKLCGALLVNYWLYAIAGAALLMLPFFLLAYLTGLGGLSLTILLIVGFIPALILVLLGTLVGIGIDIFYRLPENGYGICSGSSNGMPDKTGVLPLTDWLHELFQNVSNQPLDKPVTFGDLWDADGKEDAERDIELVLMTTNITRGISQRFPFLEGNWGQLFFKADEFAELFPESVVKWMTDPERRPEIQDEDKIEVPEGYHPLPAPADLPILLGARMSLSFPFLLSAVPLYAVNSADKTDAGKYRLERCWFSDGGLTSNFPIHFFDAPLPTRPTFAINLVSGTIQEMEIDDRKDVIGGFYQRMKPEQSEDWGKVWMPNSNASGISSAARFNNFDDVAGFFFALFDTARNWGDTELMAMPGYRDRIVHVQLKDDEGGLNLNMPPEIITALGNRGERAGELLAARFGLQPKKDPKTGKPIELDWDNHRWIRFRSFMAALELAVRRLTKSWVESSRDTRWRSYESLLMRGEGDLPKGYRFPDRNRTELVLSTMTQLIDAISAVEEEKAFDHPEPDCCAPRPKPVLRIMPPGSNDPRAEHVN